MTTYYSEHQQDIEYRLLARQLGCTCRPGLMAHTHESTCVLYETPAQMAERLEEEHHS